jgi:hypothetical protein
MDIADWVGTVAVAWVALSVLVALFVGRVAKLRDQQVPAMRPGKTGKTAGPALVKQTTVWRSTVGANRRFLHRQVA